jgi:hypothetical protein
LVKYAPKLHAACTLHGYGAFTSDELARFEEWTREFGEEGT